MGLAGAAAMAIILPVGFAWACVGLVSLSTSSPNVQAGGTLTVIGKEFAQKAPVLIHLDSITGPVLVTATGTPATSTMTSKFEVALTIPSSVSAGPHLLIATQDEHDMNGGNPARAVIYVGTAAPAPTAAASRPVTLLADKGLSAVTLALIGLAVAGVGLLLAWLVFRVVTRRRAEAVP
jgi:hypothetical protein